MDSSRVIQLTFTARFGLMHSMDFRYIVILCPVRHEFVSPAAPAMLLISRISERTEFAERIF